MIIRKIKSLKQYSQLVQLNTSLRPENYQNYCMNYFYKGISKLN